MGAELMPGRVSTRKLEPALTLPAVFAALAGITIGVGITLTVSTHGHPIAIIVAVLGAAALMPARRGISAMHREILEELGRIQAAASDLMQGIFALRIGTSRIWELQPLSDALSAVAGHMEAQIAELAAEAFYDPLTKLPNRALFLDRVERLLTRAKRRKGSVAVLFLDLDNFKLINDSLGHEIGDQLLLAATRRLQGAVRDEDTVARFGGDEFAIAAGDIAQPSDATQIAARVAEHLAAAFTFAEHEVFVSVSVGVALNRSEHDHPESLLRDADTAMYRAKTNGKARFELYSQDMQNQMSERLRLETDLRRAVERGELQVHYQPVVDLRSQKVVEVEALLRWDHPRRGYISPAEFIPVAEESGLIGPIGHWVLLEACQQERMWRDEFGPSAPTKVSVNLSARQFSPALVKEIQQVLHETGLGPDGLKLEITEGILMRSEASTFAILFELNELQIDLALDDFGVGYSSLSYLKRFPFSSLKIDRTFVQRVESDPEDAAVVRAIVTIARTLHMNIVAEGIESVDQYEHLRALGCDRGQGHYFARPMTAHAVSELLRTGSRRR
jgi:diguanylate cyclase (GGDEF)-like protein